MKFWRGLDLGAQVRRGPEQEPGIPVGADSNLSLAARLAAKTSGAKSTAVAASTIPLRKCAAGRRTKNLHAHGASLAADARSVRSSAENKRAERYLLLRADRVCSAALGAAIGPGTDSEIAARFPEKREGSGRYPLLVRTLYFFS